MALCANQPATRPTRRSTAPKLARTVVLFMSIGIPGGPLDFDGAHLTGRPGVPQANRLGALNDGHLVVANAARWPTHRPKSRPCGPALAKVEQGRLRKGGRR